MGSSKGYVRRVTFDDLSGCPVHVDFEEHEAHEGHAFQADIVETLTESEVWIGTILTPDDPVLRAHVVMSISMTGEYEYELLEDVTSPVGGTAAQAINRKRESTKTSQLVLTGGLTSIGGFTTRLEYHHNGSTQGRVTEGGGRRGDSEWILKPATLYAVRVTAIGAGVMSLEMGWYEHKSHDLLGI
jgi:hypothetical protein